jgi:hypothetical protein
MQQKVELKQIRAVSEIVEDSIVFLKQNWKPLLKAYFVICGFFVLASMVVAVMSQVRFFNDLKNGESSFKSAFLMVQVFEFVSLTMVTLTTLSFVALYRDKGNEPPVIEEVWGYVRFYFFRVFGSTILLLIFLALGTLFCVFPGMYLFPVFALVLPVMILENTTFGYAFNRAFKLIRNNWGPMLGVILLTFILILAVFLVITIPASIVAGLAILLTGQSTNMIFGMVFTVFGHLIQFTYVLPVIATALAYFSYTENTDDAGLMARIQTLGAHQTPAADNLPTEEY